ncbi:MAG TPA: tetratricopeptide repeat protein, partial [Gemmatimonadaceae bacterium]|nr:tetratricopeptide repeat protein [Gemmatimonadaceae bacterium]
MLIPRSALDAFRQDLAADPTAAGPADARWLQVVTLLQSAVDVAPSQRGGILDAATDLAAPDALGPDAGVRALPVTMSFAPPPVVEMAVRSAIAMEDGARFHLAYAAYDAALRLVVAEIPDDARRVEVQGVILALQGRTARQLGDVEVATKHYEAAEKLGRDARVDAVVARAWVGLGLLAQIRGNHPDARRRFTQALGLTGAAPESRQVAHQGLMVSASAAGDYDMAALHAWAAYELAPAGDEKVAALCDVAELLRNAGYPAVALRGFSAAMLRAPRSARQLL